MKACEDNRDDQSRTDDERDRLLERERRARMQAETAARARDEFLAVVSHELRAPLNAIQSWAHVLEGQMHDGPPAPLVQRALQGIRTGVAQQVRLIEDLLDATCLMSGKLRLVKQPLALLPVIRAAIGSMREIAAAKGIVLSTNYGITHEQIEGDADRIQQIMWNLLSNAVKFTPEGGEVALTVTLADGHACITVRDTGIGISREFLPYLFDRFSQHDASSTRGHSGLGLGLFLARHLAELHDGRIQAESEGENRGASFTVWLPLRASHNMASANSEGDSALPSLHGLCILLIDDQEEVRESLEIALSAAGAQVHAATSAAEALGWLSTQPLSEMPDILLCDIAMPQEDGYTALKKIRSWKPDGSALLQRMPALALTAFSQREDRLRALKAGFQMHVAKPVAPEELIIIISTMVSRG